MTSRILSACAVGACALAAAGATALGHAGPHPATPATPAPAAAKSLRGFSAETTTVLRNVGTMAPVGVAHLRQRGARLTGFIVVWGLAPGSRHANHIHGRVTGKAGAAQCFPAARRSMRHILDRPDLVADAAGVAFAVVNERVTERAIGRGAQLMVHAEPSGGHGTNPQLGCANLR